MLNCRKMRRARIAALAGTMLCPILIVTEAQAQVQYIETGQKRVNTDEFGVDLATGKFHYSNVEGVVGSGDSTIDVTRVWNGVSFGDIFPNTLKVSGNRIYIYDGQKDFYFELINGTWVSSTGGNETLSGSLTGTTVLTYGSGRTVSYSNPDTGTPPPTTNGIQQLCRTGLSNCFLVATSATSPTGTTQTLDYDVLTVCDEEPEPFKACNQWTRLTKLEKFSGAKVEFTYQPGNWFRRTKADLFPAGASSTTETVSYSYPAADTIQVTDADSDLWEYKLDTSNRLKSIKRPGESAPSTTITYDSQGRVISITRNGTTKTYSWSTNAGNTVVDTSKGTGTEEEETKVTTDPAQEQLVSTTADPNASTPPSTDYDFDNDGRIDKTTFAEGNYVEFERDQATGEITKIWRGPKGGGAKVLTYQASFIDSCTSLANGCRRKAWEEDAAGNRTDYSYDAPSGRLLKVEAPAAASGQARPTVNYSYDELTATNGNKAWRLTEQTFCRTAASCAGTANEQVTNYTYRTLDLQPETITVKSGDTSVPAATTTYSYGSDGRISSVDGPLTGTNDTAYFGYNGNGAVIWTIGPDPDGSGSRPRQFSYTKEVDGRPDSVQSGYTTATSIDGTETVVSELVYEYTDQRLSKTTLYDGPATSGTITAITQYNYDSAGNVKCTVVRNNLASTPADACTAGTAGTNAPDMISLREYDVQGRLQKLTSGYGSAVASTEEIAYTLNGQIDYVDDADDNRTDYQYDNFDRLYRQYYPVTTVGQKQASTTDFEQYVYDSRDLVTTYTDRAGQDHTYAYDNRGQLTSVTAPGKPVRAFQYNLGGNVTLATDHSLYVSFQYDALGRQTYTNLGGLSYEYDVAGRRTRLNYPIGFYVTYDYDAAGNMLSIKEKGTTTLASFTYDDMGRRATKTLNPGAAGELVQSYTHDDVSRLTGLSNNLPSTANDLTQTFGYTPAGQIESVTRSNDAYAWTGHSNIDDDYVSNGLNQYSDVEGVTITHDARGNLTANGANSFTYDSENFLTAATVNSSTNSLTYDPLGRLRTLVDGNSATTKFLYDGLDLIFESDANGNPQRWYVHGPGVDEPLVWYEGYTPSASNRRFLMDDERGSIISVTNNAGTVLGLNSYGPYGEPDSGNLGRFGYTGQTYIPELELNYYKARFYDPELGRFMQPDPIGYGDGLNVYNYVGADPVNGVDPFGWYDCELSADHPENKNDPDYDDECGVSVSGKKSNTVNTISCDFFDCIPAYIDYAMRITGELNSGVGLPDHHYDFDFELGGEDCPIDEDELAQLVQRFSTPFQPGRQAVNGRVILGGNNPIEQSFGGAVVTNRTAPGHMLHAPTGSGRVTRVGTSLGGGRVRVSTIGEGGNYGPVSAAANNFFGPKIFHFLNSRMAAFARENGFCDN